ncbi:metallophosphoesterase family protein [Bacteroidota bacterium]
MKIAVVSDIHGNIWALKEVLRDIENKRIDLILNLGDSLYGPLDPVGTAKILMQSDIISISGNEDEVIVDENAGFENHQSLKFVRSEIRQKEIIDWINSLKHLYKNEFLIAFHGTLESNNKYLLEDITKGFPVIKSEDELQEILNELNYKLILCGHSHLPKLEKFNNKIIVNPGSVGLQAYFDDSLPKHYMETNDPRASYAVVEITDKEVNVNHIKVEYDWQKASVIAEQNGRPDWAYSLTTGKAMKA